MMTRTCLCTVTVSAMSLLCSGMAAAQDADIRAKVEDFLQSFEQAVAAGDYETIGSVFAEDTTFLPPTGGLIEDREGARSFYEESKFEAIDIRSTRTQAVGENLILDVGTFTGTLPEEAGGTTLEGEYVALAEDTGEGLRIISLTSFPTRQPPEAQAGQ